MRSFTRCTFTEGTDLFSSCPINRSLQSSTTGSSRERLFPQNYSKTYSQSNEECKNQVTSSLIASLRSVQKHEKIHMDSLNPPSKKLVSKREVPKTVAPNKKSAKAIPLPKVLFKEQSNEQK